MVVDSSTDNTPEIVREFSPDVTLIRSESRLPPGPARNLGIQRARAQIVAFTDADCIVNKDWIDNICEAHKLHDAVGGKIMNGTPRNPFGTALYFTEFAEFGTNENRIVASVPTCNMSYKKKVFEKYGVFPDIFWGEEYVLNTKIEEQILFSGNIVVKHMNRTNFAATVRHSYKVGNGCALSRIVANRQGYLFRYKLLIPLTWLYRFIKIGGKSIQAGNFLGFIFVMPFIVIDLFAWTLGFLKGAFEYSSLRESVSDSAS
jgi:glycosyltransferase involved in cell wall biosynthesis